MIDHQAMITEILNHLSGAKPLSKERRSMIAAILKDPGEKDPFMAAATPMWGEIKSALQALVDAAGADAKAKAVALSAARSARIRQATQAARLATGRGKRS